ncbi:MAG: efflux RND transporter periplasmic adaptor subunit [Pirellulaceae bacterium]
MKFPFRKLLAITLIGGIGAAGTVGYKPAKQYWANRNRVEWETVEVKSGDVTRYVNSTGTIEPVLKVSIGSFVSGPIVELNVDFNDVVKEGDILARVDPRLFRANVDRDEASLASREAELQRVEAQLQQSLNNYQRGKNLRDKNEEFLSDRELDALTFEVKSLQAQRRLAKASILQSKASLETSRANLNYCEITSPVDGIVIKRNIDPGQTLAAQFQTPELFIVAPDLREKVHVFASVDEADMGLIQNAEKTARPVTFTIDAHPDDIFKGEIEQIRVSSVATSNVVTYPVVVAASNPDMKLLPGMTAEISFEVDSKQDVVKIPREALAFVPMDIQLVREEDRKLIDGSQWKPTEKENKEKGLGDQNAIDRSEARRKRNQRHVWKIDGEKLRAVEVQIGLSESGFTEMVSGDLKAGDKLVSGKKTK